VNISLDTLDPDTFRAITRRGNFQQVMDGIDAAEAAGLDVKINTVALKHQNAHEIPSMIEWAHGRGFDMTLIEVMPLGLTGEDRYDQYIPLFDIRDQLEERWSLSEAYKGGATAGPSRYVDIKETGGRLGFITPLTNNFCAGCNRVRVTCTGRIYMCLGQDDHIDLRAALRESADPQAALDDALDRALIAKPERHEFAIEGRDERPALPRHMSVTGG
jgi:cyclic pyranopterin phosphate synthase